MAQLQVSQRTLPLIAPVPIAKRLPPRTLAKRPRIGEAIIQHLLLICGLVSILATGGILLTLGENALLFFRQRAFEQASYNQVVRAEVINMDVEIALAAGVNDQTTRIPIGLDSRASSPFKSGQLIDIDNETMRITATSNSGLTVERGVNDTEMVAHTAQSPLFMHITSTVLLAADVKPNDTAIAVSPGAAHTFAVGDLVRMDEETLRVTAVDGASDTLTVERGVEDSNALGHHANLPVFTAKSVTLIEFFTGTQWNPQLGQLGIWPLLNATLMTTFFALLIALPLGLGVAIYLSEFATPRIRAMIKPMLELLVGVPTVVYGYFALTFMTPLLQSLLGSDVKQFNTLAAGLVMGIMIVPTIASISEDALSAVPRALREASYALGATKIETISKVVLPAAVSGIMAAFLLGISRAVGETMIVALAAGAGSNFTFNPLEGAETMTGHIVRIAGGDISYNTIDYNSLFAIGLLLFLLTLVFNVVSSFVTRRFREVY